MHKLPLFLKLKSPLLFPQAGGNPNAVSGTDYIPGSAILGAFAHRYIQQHQLGKAAHESPEFKHLFLSDQVFFQPAYIAEIQNKRKFTRFFPAPLSFQKRKDSSEYRDQLIELEVEGSFQNLGRYISKLDDKNFKSLSVKKQLLYHQTRPLQDEKTDLKDQNKLLYQENPIPFTYEAIQAFQAFYTEIIGQENDLKILQELLIGSPDLRLGRSRSSHYGEVAVDAGDITAYQRPTGNLENIAFTETLSMTLLSDTIVYNQHGMAAVSLENLQAYLPEGVTLNTQPGKCFVRSRLQENFVSVWNQRRPADLTFQAGSCFWLELSSPTALEALKQIEVTGLGERRGEGFGRVVLGWQSEKSINTSDFEPSKSEIPSGEIPELTQKILQKTLEIKSRESVGVLATKKADEFSHRLPSKSLLGRLEQTLQNEGVKSMQSMIDQLAKPAKDKLKRCRSQNETLQDFLSSELSDNIGYRQKLKDIHHKLSTHCPSLNLNESDLDKHFYLIFLRQLRKAHKGEQKA